jgi:Ca2+-binding RTX toxin-like protein
VSDADGLGTFSFQWQAGTGGTFTDIAGATAATFTPGAAQVGQQLQVVASYLDGHGTAESVTSAATAVVTAAPVAGITLIGTAGNDNLQGRAGGDTLHELAGNDTLNGGNGNDTLTGGNNPDILNGDAGDGTLAGGDNTDTLNGGAGNDILHTSGGGNDIFVFGAGFGDDTIQPGFDATGGVGAQDLLDISALGITAATFAAQVHITDVGNDTFVEIGTESVLLLGVNGVGTNAITQSDFILA